MASAVWVYVLVTSLFYEVSLGSPSLRAPQEGYVQLSNGGYYKLHTQQRSWFDAEAQCQREGAHLVVLDSVEEAAALRSHLEAVYYPTNKGLSYFLHAGFRAKFATYRGDPQSFVRWSPNEPNGRFCGQLDNEMWLSYVVCSNWQMFICEYRDSLQMASENVSLSRDESSQPRLDEPPEGFEALPCCPGTYYKVQTGNILLKNQSYEDQSELCEYDNAHLPVIDSESEAEDLIDLLTKYQFSDAFYVGFITNEPVTVLGGLLSEIAYQRWDGSTFITYCCVANKKLAFSVVSCSWPPSVRNICEANVY